MQIHIKANACVCYQVSHTLHLSAVTPSYYRFHVEHLQSDDYSKDKVQHESLMWLSTRRIDTHTQVAY